MRLGALVVIASVGGCAKAPEFDDPGTPVSVLEQGFGRTVIGPGYQMVFHGGEQAEVHMPESLTIAGSETLATGPIENRLERLIGFGFYPALIATADTNGTVLEADITTNDDGPFVAQISTTFKISYICDAPINTHQFSATSVFTFFPNGRINRFDTAVQAVADGDSLTNSPGATCPPAPDTFNPGLVLTSFWTFPESGNTVTAGPTGDDVAVPNGGVDDVPGACTFLTDRAIGVRYKPQSTRVDPNPNADAHVFDFIDAPTSISGNDKFDVISQVQLRNTGDLSCGEVLAQLVEPAIRVGDEEVPTPNQDGIYEDPFNPRSGPFNVEVIGSTAVPSGWVLATELASDSVKITHSDGSDVNYNVQRLEVGLTRFLIVFNEPLEPGDPITIESL